MILQDEIDRAVSAHCGKTPETIDNSSATDVDSWEIEWQTDLWKREHENAD